MRIDIVVFMVKVLLIENIDHIHMGEGQKEIECKTKAPMVKVLASHIHIRVTVQILSPS